MVTYPTPDKKLHEHFYITDSQGIFFFLAKNILGNVPFNGDLYRLQLHHVQPHPCACAIWASVVLLPGTQADELMFGGAGVTVV